MMIYVPPEIRLAVKNRAAEMKLSASDVFVEAVRDYLAARGFPIADEPPVGPFPGSGPPAPVDPVSLGVALDRQARLIEELLLRFDEAVPRRATTDTAGKPAGTTVARGMTVLLIAIRAAGEGGLDNAAIRAAMALRSISSGSAETAKAVLREAGIIRQVDRKWVLAMS